MEPIVVQIIATVGVITSAFLAYLATKEKRRADRAERRGDRRQEEMRLSMDLMAATCALSLTTSKKLAGMHTNGDVEEAMNAAMAAQKAYQDFIRNQAATNATKI